MESGSASVLVAITVICGLLAQGMKATPLPHQWLPVLCGVCGGLLGLLGFYSIPGYPAQSVITAVALGIESGLAATGVHQAVKQMKGCGERGSCPDDPPGT